MRLRKLLVAAIITLMSSFMGVTAYAGTWQKDNIGWWYRQDNGSYPSNQWMQDGNKWYYFDGNGYMVTNRWIGNYYLGTDGAMLVNTVTPDGYQVDANGEWIKDKSSSSVNEKLMKYKIKDLCIEDSYPSTKLQEKDNCYVTTNCRVVYFGTENNYENYGNTIENGLEVYWSKDCKVLWKINDGDINMPLSKFLSIYPDAFPQSQMFPQELDENGYIVSVMIDGRSG